MNGDQKQFTLCFIAVTLFAIVVTLSTVFYHSDRNDKILKAIQAGADPIDAAVALDNIYPEKSLAAYLGKNK